MINNTRLLNAKYLYKHSTCRYVIITHIIKKNSDNMIECKIANKNELVLIKKINNRF